MFQAAWATKEKLNKIYLRIISSLHVILNKILCSHPPLDSLVPKVWCYSIWGHEEPVHVTQVSHLHLV